MRDAGDRYQVKRITVKPGEGLSVQMHHHRAEHWVVAVSYTHLAFLIVCPFILRKALNITR